ncbi:hypothetical protein TNCV_3802771 [Trichonephila clavipes]|nr:hypothetical protein TNCV_3802771 [Trichonephila clavipes]
MTPELASPLLTTTPHQREDVRRPRVCYADQRAIDDEPRHYESWSSDEEEPELGPSSPNYPTPPNGGRFISRQI